MDALERLTTIAMEEFTAKGYSGISLNDILRKANVSKGSFYYHFSGKESLYSALVGKVIEEKWKHMKKLGLTEPGDDGLFQLLRTQIRAALAFTRERPEYEKFSESVLKEKHQEIRDRVFKKFKLDNRDRLLHLVRRAVEKGEIRDDIAPEQINHILIFFLQNMAEISAQVSIADFEGTADWLLDFLENGLKRPK